MNEDSTFIKLSVLLLALSSVSIYFKKDLKRHCQPPFLADL